MLKSVVYPTGGKHNYEYECNKVTNFYNQSLGYIPGLTNVGGARIHKIVLEDGQNSIVREFDYHDEEGSGKLYSVPQFVKIPYVAINNTYSWMYKRAFVNSDNPYKSNLTGYLVGYEKVDILTENNGFTRYGYHCVGFPNIIFESTFMEPPIDLASLNGKLIKVQKYAESGSLVQETINNYTSVELGSQPIRKFIMINPIAKPDNAPSGGIPGYPSSEVIQTISYFAYAHETAFSLNSKLVRLSRGAVAICNHNLGSF
jgi:hypothetical protein